MNQGFFDCKNKLVDDCQNSILFLVNHSDRMKVSLVILVSLGVIVEVQG